MSKTKVLIITLFIIIVTSAVQVFADREIRLKAEQHNLSTIDSAPEEQPVIPDNPMNYVGVTDVVSKSLTALTNEATKEAKITQIMRVTTLMDRETAEEFVRCCSPIVNSNISWSVELEAVKTVSDDEAYMFVMINPESFNYSAVLLEFAINNNKIQNFTTY